MMSTGRQPPFQKSFLTVNFLFWAALLIALLPWLYIRSQQATHSDILWLCEALQRLLDGHKLSEAAYETNPPLSVLIYILPVLAKTFLHIPLHYAVFFQTVVLTALSTIASHKIMRGWAFLNGNEVNILTAGYLLAVTVGASLYFGERDHLVALALIPFVLAQLTLTFRWPQAKGWMTPIFALGAVFILLKPHHGLLPTILLAHRLLVQKRMSVVLDRDFVCLAITTLSYVILVPVIFPDYVSVILPDVIQLYLPMGAWDEIKVTIGFTILISQILLIVLFSLKLEKFQTFFILFFLLSAQFSLIPYAVQGMGFYYHAIPVLAFLFPTIGFILLSILKTQLPKERTAIFFNLVMILSMAYLYAPLNIDYPKHKDFAEFPLSKMLRECGKEDECSFFMFNKEMGIIHETSYYADIHHASRFSSFWFLGEIIREQKKIENGDPSRLTKEQTDAYFEKYAGLIAEDLNRDKPEIVLIWKWDDSIFADDFVKYFSADEDFAKAWEPYRKIGNFELNYADYYKLVKVEDKEIVYDLYRRNSP